MDCWMDGWMDGSWMNNVRICPKDDWTRPRLPGKRLTRLLLCHSRVCASVWLLLMVLRSGSSGVLVLFCCCLGEGCFTVRGDSQQTAASNRQPASEHHRHLSLDSGLVATGLGHRIEGSSIWHCAVFGRELPPQAFSGAVAVLALKGGARSERPDPKRRRAGQRTRSTLALALSGACSGGGVHSINAHCSPLLPTARCLLLLLGACGLMQGLDLTSHPCILALESWTNDIIRPLSSRAPRRP